MKIDNQSLVNVLTDNTNAGEFDIEYWSDIIRQARSSLLLGQVAHRVDGVEIPQSAKNHLDSASQISKRQRQTVGWEIEQLRKILAPLAIPVILLKGAAYASANLPPAEGRTFNDIDILVPPGKIAAVEEALLQRQWAFIHDDEYDQQYFRKWMHELPPLQHVSRKTMLDVHHTILPLTMKVSLDAELLVNDSIALNDDGTIRVLALPDMILHSASHLFYGGEFDAGLRDLFDLHLLLALCGQRGEIAQLKSRADELDLSLPLEYAFRHTQETFGYSRHAETQIHRGTTSKRRFSDHLFKRVFLPMSSSYRDPSCQLSRFLLFMRGHFLRMPLPLLIPHLIRKSIPRKKPGD